jgi:hypothetical protein
MPLMLPSSGQSNMSIRLSHHADKSCKYDTTIIEDLDLDHYAGA